MLAKSEARGREAERASLIGKSALKAFYAKYSDDTRGVAKLVLGRGQRSRFFPEWGKSGEVTGDRPLATIDSSDIHHYLQAIRQFDGSLVDDIRNAVVKTISDTNLEHRPNKSQAISAVAQLGAGLLLSMSYDCGDHSADNAPSAG